MSEKTLTITIGNSYCKVTNTDRPTKALIYNDLSYKVNGAWFSPAYKKGWWDGKLHLMNLKTSEFPTGLLSRVVRLLDEADVEYQLLDARENLNKQIPIQTFNSITLSDRVLRDYQVDAVNKTINQKMGPIQFQRGIINIATNGGKTVIASAIIREALDSMDPDDMFLFVTHSKEIGYQTAERLREDLNIPVGFIGDGKVDIKQVNIVIVATAASWRKRGSPEYSKLMNKTVGWIADECHHSQSDSWYQFLTDLNGAIVRIGLTGTVSKEPDREARLHAITGEVLIKITNDFLIKQEYSAYPECYMTIVDKPDYNASGFNYQQAYSEGIVSNFYRNWVIAKICEYEVNTKNSAVLVLVEHIKQGVNILQTLRELSPGIKSEFLHGSLDTDERNEGLFNLKTKELDVVVATAILDEGVDVPNINTLVYARGGKSIRKVLQSMGRGLRKKEDGSNLRFYDFIDATSPYLLKHSEERHLILKNDKFNMNMFYLDKDLGVTVDEEQAAVEKYVLGSS